MDALVENYNESSGQGFELASSVCYFCVKHTIFMTDALRLKRRVVTHCPQKCVSLLVTYCSFAKPITIIIVVSIFLYIAAVLPVFSYIVFIS